MASNEQMKKADGSEEAVPTTAAMLFSGAAPEEERPTQDNRVLEVVMVWSNTIINVRHLRPGKGRITLGPVGGKYDFVLSGDFMPGDEWALVESKGDEFVVRTGGQMRLEAVRGTVGGESHTLGLEDQVVVHAGEVDFVIRYVRESNKLSSNVWKTVDFYFTKVFSTSLVAHAAFFVALLLTPIHTSEISEDLFANPNRFAKLIIEPEDDKPKKKFEEISELEEEDQREEVKFGEKVELKEDLPDKKGAPVVDVDKREQDKKKVMKTGLLAALDSGGPGSGSNIFSGGLGTGINNALGGLQNGAGDAMGVGGMGSRGVGAGGGGSGLGIGGLGTKGGGGGGGKGYGSISIGDRGRKKTSIQTAGDLNVMGGMDPAVIARIVRKHQNEIKFCYERELQKDPNLYGKVAVLWVIDPTGAVATASIAQTTMGNSNVENCILQRVKRWKFPQPKGGGVVQVTYPWMFKSGG